MSSATPPLHVTFSSSAMVSLLQAFDRLGRKEEVLPLVDRLGCGPIEPGTFEQRRQWMDDELGIEYDAWYEERVPAFWERVTTMRTPIVAWMSQRSADEHCGFLELLWRVQDAPLSVVDVTDVDASFSGIRSDVIVDRKLYERAAPVAADDRARHAADWRRLRAENAALRVMTDAGLASAPITHFDDVIRSFVTADWQKCNKVIANVLGKLRDGRYQPPGSDDVLFGRLLALMDDERIEGESTEEYWSMQTSRVRRVPGATG
jgi:hypothetical protein